MELEISRGKEKYFVSVRNIHEFSIITFVADTLRLNKNVHFRRDKPS